MTICSRVIKKFHSQVCQCFQSRDGGWNGSFQSASYHFSELDQLIKSTKELRQQQNKKTFLLLPQFITLKRKKRPLDGCKSYSLLSCFQFSTKSGILPLKLLSFIRLHCGMKTTHFISIESYVQR